MTKSAKVGGVKTDNPEGTKPVVGPQPRPSVSQIQNDADKKVVADKKKKIEHWISNMASEHSIIVKAGNDEAKLVKFKDYRLVLDMTDPEDRAVSEGLHKSGREARDIFLLGPAYEENDIGGRAALMGKLREMNVKQLRSMVSHEDLVEFGVHPSTQEQDTLIAVIMATKSIGDGVVPV